MIDFLRRWGLKAWPAGPVLASKLSPRWGCSWVFDAIELRLFYARYAIILCNRVAIVWRTMCECLCAEGAAAQREGCWWLIVDCWFSQKSGELFGEFGNNTYLCGMNNITQMIMETKNITREEALRRFRSTRERKEKRLEEMKDLLYKRYINRTGEEPKYFFALWLTSCLLRR